jgi:hypothetical protein
MLHNIFIYIPLAGGDGVIVVPRRDALMVGKHDTEVHSL